MRAPLWSARRQAVIARVEQGWRPRGSLTRLVASGIFLIGLFAAAPASAEVGATASIFSDARFRGYSLSEGRPVAILDFAYDDQSGLYADTTGTFVLRRGGAPAPLAVQLTGGYAKRLQSGTTLDFGVTEASYSQYSTGKGRNSYTEVYAGIARGGVSSRIFLSPHYSERGLWTAYGDISGSFGVADKWDLDAHVGMLVPLRTPANGERYRTAYDWRIGVSRAVGRLAFHAAWSQGARGRAYYNSSYRRSGLVLGASLVL
jgi:uncharacterized protein (TIGR02001 family)